MKHTSERKKLLLNKQSIVRGKSQTSIVTYFIFISSSNKYIVLIKVFFNPWEKNLEITEQVWKVL